MTKNTTQTHKHMNSTQSACYILVSLHTTSWRQYHRANGALGYNIDELTVSRSWQVLRQVIGYVGQYYRLWITWAQCVFMCWESVFMTEQTLHRLALWWTLCPLLNGPTGGSLTVWTNKFSTLRLLNNHVCENGTVMLWLSDLFYYETLFVCVLYCD